MEDIKIPIPQAPSVNDYIELPYGALKFNNGVEVDKATFKVKKVVWVLKEKRTLPVRTFNKVKQTYHLNIEYDKVIIYVKF